MGKLFFLFISLTLSVVCVSANNQVSSDENGDGKPDTWTAFDDEGIRNAIYYDSDFDGTIDYVHVFNRGNERIEERLDYNHDGEMDDYYYYANDVLQRREMDTNYDTKIDVWVYLREGVYIQRYEQDVDFDGEIDKIKSFGEE